MEFTNDRVYRVKAVADVLDVSPQTIYRAIAAGELDVLKIGSGKGSLRLEGHAVNAYLQACKRAAAAGGAA